jgi:hypothetical protein
VARVSLLRPGFLLANGSLPVPIELSSRPELRTRISYFALLATTTYAALLKESRMQFIKATDLDRKSGGGALWRACPERSRTGTCGSFPIYTFLTSEGFSRRLFSNRSINHI